MLKVHLLAYLQTSFDLTNRHQRKKPSSRCWGNRVVQRVFRNCSQSI